MNDVDIVAAKQFSTCSIENIKAKLTASTADACKSLGNSIVAPLSTGTLTSTGSPVPTEITDDADTFLGAHNICRRKALGDDLYTPLAEDSGLVSAATAYAQTLVNDNCRFEHSDSTSGENLYLYGAGVSPFIDDKNFEALSAEMWCEEPLVNESGGAIYNHHTQVAWAKTSRVGCGQASRASSSHPDYQFGCTIVVCRYETAGNMIGQSFSDV
jgi:hypothetical protein